MPNRILGFELEQFILEVLRKNSLYKEAYYEKKFTVDSKSIRPDIFVERTRNKSWEKLIIEVKSLSTLNDKSIESMITQVERYQELLKKQEIPVKTAVIVLGIATTEQREKFKEAKQKELYKYIK